MWFEVLFEALFEALFEVCRGNSESYRQGITRDMHGAEPTTSDPSPTRPDLRSGLEGNLTFRLQQTQLAGACDRFGAPQDLELVEDLPIVPLDRVQGEEQPLADLLIREALSDEVEDF